MLRPADVDGGGALRIVLGAVDIGPRRGMQNEVGGREVGRRRRADVPVSVRERSDLITVERLDERPAELAVRTGD